MRHILFFALLLFSGIVFQLRAQKVTPQYTTAVCQNQNSYSFYVIIHAKDSVLIKKDTIEDTYYGNRKRPNSIFTKINPYNKNELLLYWTEHNTLSEGETGSEGTKKKFISIIDLTQKKEIFQHEYYSHKDGWVSTINNTTHEIQEKSYDKSIREETIVFSKQTITITTLNNKKRRTFIFRPDIKRYVEQ
jgi:hypothetical protein